MKKLALLVALAMVASAPALAAPKKSKKVAAAPAASPIVGYGFPGYQGTAMAAQNPDSNMASYRLARDGLPVVLPSWSIPIYLKIKEGEKADTPKKVRKAKRAKASAT